MVEVNIRKDQFGRLFVSFPYDPLIVAKVKTIEGRRWHPVEKHWSFPKKDGILEKILKVFGDETVQIEPFLQGDLPPLKGTVPDLQTDNPPSPPFRKLILTHKWGRWTQGLSLMLLTG